MRLSRKVLIWVIGLALVGMWWGIPTFNKWRADKLVDELCAKNGGVKVYETVSLPKERFNQWSQFEVRNESYMKPEDEFFYISKYSYVIGSSVKSSYGDLDVLKMESSFYRKSDKKLLGDATTFSRRGGDPIGPWHPSSYSCPQKINPEKKIFLKN